MQSLILLAGAIGFLAGTIGFTQEAASASVADPWYRQPKLELIWKLQRSELNNQNYVQVAESSEKDALRILESKRYRELDAEQVRKFSGGRLVMEGKKKPYLVRGVSFNEDTGRFSVYADGGVILVLHTSLGRPELMKRRALLVLLDSPLRDAYAYCYTAL